MRKVRIGNSALQVGQHSFCSGSSFALLMGCVGSLVQISFSEIMLAVLWKFLLYENVFALVHKFPLWNFSRFFRVQTPPQLLNAFHDFGGIFLGDLWGSLYSSVLIGSTGLSKSIRSAITRLETPLIFNANTNQIYVACVRFEVRHFSLQRHLGVNNFCRRLDVVQLVPDK